MSNIKQHQKRIAYSCRLGKKIDYIRFLFLYATHAKRNRQFRKQHPGFIFPQPYMMYETFSLRYEDYYASGMSDSREIIEEVKPYISFPHATVLEWGCGPARLIRHFPYWTGKDNTFYATDYNPGYINWCRQNIPGISFLPNTIDPPLPIDSKSINFLYSISVFTHLSAAHHQA